MITKLGLDCIASFESLATLETDKKVNLIYGLNGTGKTTFSNFLYDRTCTEYSNCLIEGLNDEILLVYNRKFIQEYFYESDSLKGIFTLSKENKEAEGKINGAQVEIEKLQKEVSTRSEQITKLNNDYAKRNQSAENIVWEIKTLFTGGDRVLEFCLEGLKGKKEKLLNYLSSISKPLQKPEKTIEILKKESGSLKGENAQRYDLIPLINFSATEIESNILLQKEIIGNENSTIAGLIKHFNNSDWVKNGLKYLPDEISVDGAICPFCQKNTITIDVASDIRNYFDETYENDVISLQDLHFKYKNAISSIQPIEQYGEYPLIKDNRAEFVNLYNGMLTILNINRKLIEEKIESPSRKINLTRSSEAIEDVNKFIKNINREVAQHNAKIDNKEDSLKQIKKAFWDIMRWEYDQTLSQLKIDEEDVHKKTVFLNKEIHKFEDNISDQKAIIKEQQKSTVNIDAAISNINDGLKDLGIDGFRIIKHSNRLYKIVRKNQSEDTFQTLSEGEKMIISFLYFRELCFGKGSAAETDNKKIVVIDDPISSLSHVFVFNIGTMIKYDFFNSQRFSQVFVLTHSLYFFYELADMNKERRNMNQKLFRMTKDSNGSHIVEMGYDEVQNDYHSYWLIIKDENQASALIANCMRNIVEYFFSFIEKRDLNSIFQKPELKANKYQAFCRFINRESHSHGQNIFDYKEFNYNDFKDALALVFELSGYKEHYQKMIK